jgi:hypothetical protein
VRKRIQASIFRTLGFDVGLLASGVAAYAVFEELRRLGITPPDREYWIYEDPIEELMAEPLPPDEDTGLEYP